MASISALVPPARQRLEIAGRAGKSVVKYSGETS